MTAHHTAGSPEYFPQNFSEISGFSANFPQNRVSMPERTMKLSEL